MFDDSQSLHPDGTRRTHRNQATASTMPLRFPSLIDQESRTPIVPKGFYRDLALWYRFQLGLSVVPLACGRKKPSVPKGGASALMSDPLSETLINKNWGQRSMMAVGAFMGSVSSGVIAIDVDEASDFEGWANANPVLAASLPTSRTRRGYQVFLRDSDGWTGSVDLRKSHGLEREVKGDKTLVVLPGSYVNQDGNGKPLDCHIYHWIVPPKFGEGGDWPTIDLRSSGLVPVDFDRRNGTKSNRDRIRTQDTQDTQGDSGHTRKLKILKETQGRGGDGQNSVEPIDALDRVETLVLNFPIDGPGQRRNALKSMVFQILRVHRGEKPALEVRVKIHECWWDLFGQHCTTDHDESFLEFDRMIEEINGDFLSSVESAMRTIELPYWCKRFGLREPGTNVLSLVLACDQCRNANGTFFIAIRSAAEICGVDKETVGRVFKMLQRHDILKVVTPGTKPEHKLSPNKRKATEYRLLINPDGSTRNPER